MQKEKRPRVQPKRPRCVYYAAYEAQKEIVNKAVEEAKERGKKRAEAKERRQYFRDKREENRVAMIQREFSQDVSFYDYAGKKRQKYRKTPVDTRRPTTHY